MNDLTGTDYEITAGKSTFTVTHADGSTSVYDAINNADDAKNVIAKELAAGSTITLTADKNGKACNIEIVNSLTTTGGNREISSIKAGTVDQLVTASGVAADSTALKEGDSVTINGETTTFLANTPATASDLADIISKLDDGAKVQIGRNDGNNTKTPVEYTVCCK